MKTTLKRQEFWRLRYQERPYLSDVTDKELAQRFRDVVTNYVVLTEKGQIGCPSERLESETWLEKITHLMEEYNKRGGIPEGILSNGDIPMPTYPQMPKGAEAFNRISIPEYGILLVKYTEKEYAEDMIHKGRILIRPASKFNDASLNNAINDDELTIKSIASKSEVEIEVLDKYKRKSGRNIEALGDVVVSVKATTDYFVYCLSTVLACRLFGDLEYDACVIIKDTEEFSKRLARVTSLSLHNLS